MICACGCGGIVSPRKYWDSTGSHFTKYIHGHQNRGRCNWKAQKDVVLRRTSHERANKILSGVSRCELAFIGGCSGRIEVAHVDTNPQNNAVENLLKLCRTHHCLIDNGKIDLDNPRMPEFYVSHGQPKRRYIYRKTAWIRKDSPRNVV
jgi:hypothetical protein